MRKLTNTLYAGCYGLLAKWSSRFVAFGATYLVLVTYILNFYTLLLILIYALALPFPGVYEYIYDQIPVILVIAAFVINAFLTMNYDNEPSTESEHLPIGISVEKFVVVYTFGSLLLLIGISFLLHSRSPV